jgi:hypothetical protein
VRAKLRRRLRECKRRFQRRLRQRQSLERRRLFRDHNDHSKVGDNSLGPHAGGLGAVRLLVRQLGLVDATDGELHLLKRDLP